MKTGIVQVSDYIKDMSKSKIPLYASDFKREYQFIRGLNLYCGRLSKRLDRLNHGLFETDLAITIKKYMKRFLRAQEKGKFTNISKFVFPNDDDIYNYIIIMNENFLSYKLRYDFFVNDDDDDGYCINYDTDDTDDTDNTDDSVSEYFVDGKPYPGFIEFYDIFKKIYNQLKINVYHYDDDVDNECYTGELDFSYTESDFSDFLNLLNDANEGYYFDY